MRDAMPGPTHLAGLPSRNHAQNTKQAAFFAMAAPAWIFRVAGFIQHTNEDRVLSFRLTGGRHEGVGVEGMIEHATVCLAFAHDYAVGTASFQELHLFVGVRSRDDVQRRPCTARLLDDLTGLEPVGNGDQKAISQTMPAASSTDGAAGLPTITLIPFA